MELDFRKLNQAVRFLQLYKFLILDRFFTRIECEVNKMKILER